ncbi:hypothetical protein COW49_00470 [Candidatus Kaiserbacteria bacterium CG17_big_fil_post_rev_8_21_14_2_50_51_7]|uniref:Uncharacterized protein n=1 Tax=Candidatus Kaiserbacteria bacterium CG17_big_fil_post_rev_8_21_14_2_50_51_7 TaxID=1974613 RepID=A0A2M7FCT1_9BACT|nr:MAG: hypothetical protein COW49_00470 [Candidatus Kaiserbacteria bacterium CG17_big_fil_post_rev_8_21_14_2_50_51_7]
MTEEELIVVVSTEIKGLSQRLEMVDYEDAVDDALREVNCSFPVTDDTKLYWLKNRVKRHLFFMMVTQYADKFRVEDIHLHQRFDHFLKLVKTMDEEWELAKVEDPTLVADIETYALFGTKVDAGYAYDELGRDRTYDSDQLVILTPSGSE